MTLILSIVTAQFFIIPVSLLILPLIYAFAMIFMGLWNLFFLISSKYLYLLGNMEKIWPIPLVFLFSPVLLILALPTILFLLFTIFDDSTSDTTIIFNLHSRKKLDKYNKSTFTADGIKKYFNLKSFLISFAIGFIGFNILALTIIFSSNPI